MFYHFRPARNTLSRSACQLAREAPKGGEFARLRKYCKAKRWDKTSKPTRARTHTNTRTRFTMLNRGVSSKVPAFFGVFALFGVLAFSSHTLITTADAAYVHDDPSGYKHPGCIASKPYWVGIVPSANRTCPGKPMTEVWDFDSEIQPYNKKLAKDYFDHFFTSNDLLPSNDFVTPTFDDFIEPRNPPQRTGYSRPGRKIWRYQFSWQSDMQENTTSSFSDDVALEFCNMTVIREQAHLLDYIEESDCTGIAVPTLHLDSALRDDFHTFQRDKYHRWRCHLWNSTLREWTLCEEWNATKTLDHLNEHLKNLTAAWNRTLEQNNFDAWKAITEHRTLTNVSDYSFLDGDADDIDLCIANLTEFNDAITTQVKDWYVGNQNTRLAQFLQSQNYTYVENATLTWDDIYDTPLHDMNDLIREQVEAK